jgi:hypothetical protein
MLNSLIGIIASSGGGVANSYESIATVNVTSNVTSITFSSIPSTYQHLQIRVMAKSNTAGNDGLAHHAEIAFNGDTTLANYNRHQLRGDGTTAVSNSTTSAAPTACYVPSAGLTSIFGVGVVDVLDYANANKYKTTRTLTGSNNNAAAAEFVGLTSGLWQNTAAITSITIKCGTDSFTQYSSFALYGIKG